MFNSIHFQQLPLIVPNKTQKNHIEYLYNEESKK